MMAAIPQHIAIIMDGNGRWAKKNGLPRKAGHKKGAEVFQTISRYCEKIGVKALTVYAFSTENWSRSADEVNALMELFHQYLVDAFKQEGETSRVRFIGRKDRLSDKLVKLMTEIEQQSSEYPGMMLNIAVDYGGRDEIVEIARGMAVDFAEGRIGLKDFNENAFDKRSFTAGCPPVDFILRPSGEERLSNFLLWQAAYSELIYMDVLWPDFTPAHLDQAIEEFNRRNRRFGGRS